ncbi:zinc finger protein ZAT1-like [Andrographis paniculata]|uniref:zinc finger protein ZAT1-like n=1 Tax=Andrographis paniculata TaxID=175694 RepID=UPI0021E7E7B2|nr:zinc finger protein ZAT1-like [Andrographis paniculata]
MESSSRFVCKVCCKKFSSGKSLGGHMRSHVVSGRKRSVSVSDFGGYVLRDNPRKSWRFRANWNCNCKHCGKQFQSLKALYGHLASHSHRPSGYDNDSSMAVAMEELGCCCSDTQQPSEDVGKKMVDADADDDYDYDYDESSSSVSEIDGQEVAVCLMLLSMDYGAVSDNNSVVAAEPNRSKTGNKDQNSDSDDSAYFLDECSKAESEVSVDVIKECKKNLVGARKDNAGARKDNAGAESGGSSINRVAFSCINGKRARPKVNEFRQGSGEDTPDNVVKRSIGGKSRGCNNKSHEKMKLNKNEHEHVCPVCNKVFKNGQALGGHKRSHFVGHNNPSPRIGRDLLDLNLPAPESIQ